MLIEVPPQGRSTKIGVDVANLSLPTKKKLKDISKIKLRANSLSLQPAKAVIDQMNIIKILLYLITGTNIEYKLI